MNIDRRVDRNKVWENFEKISKKSSEQMLGLLILITNSGYCVNLALVHHLLNGTPACTIPYWVLVRINQLNE